MLKFLKKPYPFNDDLAHNAKLVLLISIIALVFLFLFQPDYINSIADKEKIYLIIGISIITFLSLSLNLLILPSIFQKIFSNINWNIRKEILWNLWILFVIASGNLLLFNYLSILNFDLVVIFKIILYGLIPIALLITINQDRLLRSNLKTAIDLNKKLQERKSIQERMVFFESDYMKDSLSIKVSSLLFVRSANNYIEVFWLEGDKATSQMIRSSLKKTEEILMDYKFIFKCHRSYIININHIEKITGNYQGYKLSINNIDFPIPVSQNYIAKFKEMI
ncbi:LytR/AlgR family response regulator transcription factor [Bacteroidota bacterium]